MLGVGQSCLFDSTARCIHARQRSRLPVQQDQVGLQFLSLLNRSQTIRCFSDDT